METDICDCGRKRGEHTTGVELGPGSVCLGFRLDRKATWKAERGQHKPRMCMLLTGCRICGARGAVTYYKTERGDYLHASCPGPEKKLELPSEAR